MSQQRSGAGPSASGGDERGKWPTWAKIASAAGAVVLAFFVAISTGLGQRLVERIWPSTPPAAGPHSPMAAPELVVATFAPPDVDLSCNHDVNVAGLSSSPNPAELPPIPPGELQPARDPRTIAVNELQAIPWYRSLMHVGLSTADEVPAFIMKVEPMVFERTNAKPAWGLEFSPPCGGTAQYRVFETVLDQGSIKDLGVVGIGIDGGGPRSEPLGQAFTVSASDPAVLTVHAYACAGYFEWGLKISYVVQGEQKEAWVGTPEQPLRMIGSWSDVQRYHGEWDGQTRIVAGPKSDRGQPAVEGIPVSASDECR